MTILVISHTEHYLNTTTNFVEAWGSTVRELDFLAEKYGNVIHIACYNRFEKPPKSAVSYSSGKVEFVPIPIYGGKGILNKLSIFLVAPRIINTIFKQLKKCDVFQFRAPTSMGIYVIPILTWFSKKKGWYKYAGNWTQNKKPISYNIQKVFLERFQKRPVTINGNWEGQKDFIFTFENPSLTMEDIEIGKNIISEKSYNNVLVACFVGRLEKAKGVERIIENLDLFYQKGIKKIHFVGSGEKFEAYRKATENSAIKCIFHGFLDKLKIIEIYKESHLNVLPSNSEGFPKVISEGANYGCVPIVSNVSSIGQYINNENGYLWNIGTQNFSDFIKEINFSPDELFQKALKSKEITKLFTFDSMANKLEKVVFNQFDKYKV